MVGNIFSMTDKSLLLLQVNDDRAQEMQLRLVELAPKSCILIPVSRFSSQEALKSFETQVVRQVIQVLLSWRCGCQRISDCGL